MKPGTPGSLRPSFDIVQQRDEAAAAMRDYYEANKPLRWWQRRRVWNSCEADNLMLGLLLVGTAALDRAK